MIKEFVTAALSRVPSDDDARTVAARIAETASAGLVVPVDPDTADDMGAFVDEAVPLDVALDSRFDDTAE